MRSRKQTIAIILSKYKKKQGTHRTLFASKTPRNPEHDAMAKAAHTWEDTKPWLLTPDTMTRAGITYNPSTSVSREAEYINGVIVVGPKFFAHPPNVRRNILYHEAGHAISDDMLMNPVQGHPASVWTLLDSGDLPGGSNVKLDNLNGQTTPGEVVAEAYSVLHDEPEFLIKHFPKLANAVRARAKAMGFPLPPTKKVK